MSCSFLNLSAFCCVPGASLTEGDAVYVSQCCVVSIVFCAALEQIWNHKINYYFSISI